VDTSALKLSEHDGSLPFFDNNVGAIESEVNTYALELLVEGVDANLLLTLQLRRLLVSSLPLLLPIFLAFLSFFLFLLGWMICS